MSEMIERVAQAICAAEVGTTWKKVPPEIRLAFEKYKESWLFRARAAIAAMRDVPDDVLKAARSTADAGNCLSPHWPNRSLGLRDVWVSVIDAALKP